jgi:hypothetical protein
MRGGQAGIAMAAKSPTLAVTVRRSGMTDANSANCNKIGLLESQNSPELTQFSIDNFHGNYEQNPIAQYLELVLHSNTVEF